VGDASDNFVRHTVEIVPERADHPIVAGISDFELTTEQYWVLSDGYNDVLATTTLAARDFDPWHRPVTCPAIWTRQWGQGRVFVSTPGHDLAVVQDPNVRTVIERGILWASR
jgi:type 1 glutamine amidotransferase